MSYAVKELFKTLQGEGAMAGRAAVFCRFSGCNLWSGLERDRSTAICKFCDTEFVGMDGHGGGRFPTARDLASAIEAAWGHQRKHRYVVFTGGEPLLQLDASLIETMHRLDFKVAIETNGTIAALPGVDWICVSPKAWAPLHQRSGNELKLVYPQASIVPEDYELLNFQHFFVQPMDGPQRQRNTELAVAFCLEHPRWRISLQTHKLMGIP